MKKFSNYDETGQVQYRTKTSDGVRRGYGDENSYGVGMPVGAEKKKKKIYRYSGGGGAF